MDLLVLEDPWFTGTNNYIPFFSNRLWNSSFVWDFILILLVLKLHDRPCDSLVHTILFHSFSIEFSLRLRVELRLETDNGIPLYRVPSWLGIHRSLAVCCSVLQCVVLWCFIDLRFIVAVVGCAAPCKQECSAAPCKQQCSAAGAPSCLHYQHRHVSTTNTVMSPLLTPSCV